MRTKQLSSYNERVRQAYLALLKGTLYLISLTDNDELHHTLQRKAKAGIILHELLNPLFYLKLQYDENDKLAIHYGFETISTNGTYSDLIDRFARSVYRLTARERGGINIEGCVRSACCIYTCSELYEYISDRSRYHTFKVVHPRILPRQRKRLLSIA